jgi:hypothetical protein
MIRTNVETASREPTAEQRAEFERDCQPAGRVLLVSVEPVGWKVFGIEASLTLPRSVTFDEEKFGDVLTANGAMSVSPCEREDVGTACLYRWQFEVEANSRIRAARSAHDFLNDAWASCKVLPRPEGFMDFDVVVREERWELLSDE